MTTRPECYGAMLPDLTRVEFNRPSRGKALIGRIKSQGIVAQSTEVELDAQGWEQCLACQEYRSCYDLSMARLALQQALIARC